MATNDRNIRLRVSAQTEGLNELQRVSESLAKLEKSQDEFARSAGTAGRSLRDLENELRDLNRTAGSLNKLADLNDSFFAQRQAFRASSAELRRARAELERYRAENDRATVGARKYDTQIKSLQKSVDLAARSQTQARNTAARYADDLRRVGLNSAEARKTLEGLLAANQRQLQTASANVSTFDKRLAVEKQITAELERQRQIVRARIASERQVQSGFRQFSQQAEGAPLRALQRDVQERARLERDAAAERTRNEKRAADEAQRAERQKTENLKREINKRIEALKRERAAGGGNFGRFTRNVAAIDAAAPAQTAQRLRLANIEERYQAVLARNPALQLAAAQASRQAAAADERKAATTTRVTAANQRVAQSQNSVVAALRATAGQGRTTLDFFQRLRGQVLELAATYGSLLTAVTVAQQAIAVSIERTGIENRLLFANNNDLQRTAEDLEFVRETADRLGQSYNNLAKLYSRFAAASAAAGEPIEKTRRIFGQLAEAFTVLGLSQADVEGSFRALEQSISKGSVQAEELRGQLGDRFPGAVARFAKAIGVTVEELNKLMEAGRVSSSAIGFFAEDIAIAARATLPRATNSLQSSLRRLRTAYQDFLALIVDSGFGNELAKLARQLSDFFKSADGAAFARTISNTFSVIVTAAKLVIENIELVKLAFQALAAYLIGRVFAAALAGIVTGFGALARVLPAVSAALLGTGVAAGRAAIGVRTLIAALGPIAFLVGLAATVLLDWAFKAADAERQAEELADEMRNLANARGEELIAARDSNAAQLEEIKNTRELIKLKIEEAEKRLAAAKAANEEAQQSSQAAARSGAPVRFGNLSASAEVADARAELDGLREEDRKKADEQQQRELAGIAASARIREEGEKARVEALRLTAELEAQLADENFRKRIAQDDKEYDALVRRTQEIAGVAQQARSAGTLGQSADDRISEALSDARGIRLNARNAIRPGSSEDDKSAQRAVDERNREIQQLEEAAQEERERSLRDSLERLTEDEATAAEARVELIKLEYRDKIAEQTKFQQQATALGETGLAAQFAANIAALEGEQEQVIAIEQRETAVEGLRTKYEALNETLDASVRKRDLELERINTERELGLITSQQAEQQAEAITREYQPQILANLQALRDFIEANADALGKMFNVEEVLLQLDALQVKTETVVTAGQRRAQELKESFAQGASQALSSLGAGIADAIRGFGSFSDAIKGTRDAFLNFAADFLVQIGQMILQQAILNALQNSSTFGGLFKAAGNAIVGAAHTGAIVGKGFPDYRSVPAGIFANAPRYHSGGIVGLKSDEVPAILQTGEEVLARNDPRNAMNGGAGGGSNVQIVNAIDSESVVAAGLQGAAGRRVITNIIQANKAQFRQILAS